MNPSRIPKGDFVYFNPLSIMITNHDGVTLYSYHFSDRLKQNENLISGLWKTIEHMFNELFNQELQIWTLNDIKIIRDILTGNFDIAIYLVFEGDKRLADKFIKKLLINLLKNQLMNFDFSLTSEEQKNLDDLFGNINNIDQIYN